MSLLAVNHHYYREVVPDGGIYPINKDRLMKEVDLLRMKRRPLLQNDLEEFFEKENAETNLTDTFILTFDDGLKEQMKALQVLRQSGLGAIFFVPTAPLIGHCVLDVHKLHLVRAAKSDAELLKDLSNNFPVALRRFDLESAKRQYRYDEEDACRVKYLLNFILSPSEKSEWINRVFAEAVGIEREVSKTLYMDREDIQALATLGMLGTHGHNHRPLAQLTHDEMVHDVGTSLDVLLDIGGQAIKSISYPFGGPDAVSDAVYSVCADLGLTFGFTMRRGKNEITEMRAPLSLRRIDCNDVLDFV